MQQKCASCSARGDALKHYSYKCGGLLCLGPTEPHVDVVRRSFGGVQQQVGVSLIERAMQGLRHRLQVQVLDAPHLEPWLLPSCGKLLMGNHDVSEGGGGRRAGETWARKLHSSGTAGRKKPSLNKRLEQTNWSQLSFTSSCCWRICAFLRTLPWCNFASSAADLNLSLAFKAKG